MLLKLRMRYFTLGLAAALAALVMLSPAGSVPRHAFALTNCDVADFSNDAIEQSFLGIVNQYRSQSGLGPLSIGQPLNRAATWLANDMATQGYFSHTDLLGRDPNARMANCDVPQSDTAGENIAAGTSTAQQAFDLWRNSPPHNANMLNPAFHSIGMARAFNPANNQYGANNGYFWVTTFSGEVQTGATAGGAAPLNPAPIPPPPAPAPVQAPPQACSGVSIASNPPGPSVLVNTPVALIGNANCGAPAAYEWWLGTVQSNGSTTWQPISQYSQASKSFSWTPIAAGNYFVGVWAKIDGNNPPSGFESSAVVPISVAGAAAGPAPCANATLTPPASTLAINKSVRFTASAACGGVANYEWWGGYVFPDGTVAWQQLTQYATGNTYDWTPNFPGTYTIGYWAKNQGSNPANGYYDVVVNINYSVQ